MVRQGRNPPRNGQTEKNKQVATIFTRLCLKNITESDEKKTLLLLLLLVTATCFIRGRGMQVAKWPFSCV